MTVTVTVTAVAAALLAACTTPPPPAAAPSTSAPTTSAPAPHEPGATSRCLELASLAVRTTCAAPYVPCAEGDGCEPAGDVVGAVDVSTADGQPGYLELLTLSFMSATEARAPTKPYLEGRMTARGFVPTTTRVAR